jgi:uncharacterized protein
VQHPCEGGKHARGCYVPAVVRPILPLLFVLAACAPREPVEVSVGAAPVVDQIMTMTAGDPPPSAQPYSGDLQERLTAAWSDRDPAYRPRTHHLREDGGPKYTNRLLLETSPYLLQHAHNPVNWFPWGDEAFALAEELGRPVFLSVGYSTCHWCHVMEEESFEDAEIAAWLNDNYVCIKVDREERPDVDAIYMAAVQAMSGGSGGWPMSVWLTANRKPYYGGTYFPARDGDRGSGIGFFTIVQRLKLAHDDQAESVAENADRLVAAIQQQLSPPAGSGVAGVDVLQVAGEQAHASYDATNGGRKGGQKFPSTYPLRSMLRHHRRSGDSKALAEVTHTLTAMARGGIYDQAAGGFHRYTVDTAWQVPHFEKMLYDNALLVPAYVEAFQATGNPSFARTAREVLDYVARDMTHAGGGFYSATDADSLGPTGEREEGWFFTWTPTELAAVLGPDAAKTLGTVYDVTEGGNFEGRNILHLPRSLAESAAQLGTTEEALRPDVDRWREKLYQARKDRPAPLRDDKILAAWNGLMISAFARASFALDEPKYVTAASRAAEFVLENLRVEGVLRRAWLGAPSSYLAYLEDHAFLAQGLLDLFEATGDSRWLTEAVALDAQLQARYEDPVGGWFVTASDGEALLIRQKPAYDGAVPTGTSIHVLTLYRLLAMTGDDTYRVRAEAALKTAGLVLEKQPLAMSELLQAVDWRTDKALEVVIVVPEGVDPGPLLEPLRSSFVPNRVLLQVTEGAGQEALAGMVPLVGGKSSREGKPTAYVCEKGACKWPTTDPAKLREQITEAAPY